MYIRCSVGFWLLKYVWKIPKSCHLMSRRSVNSCGWRFFLGWSSGSFSRWTLNDLWSVLRNFCRPVSVSSRYACKVKRSVWRSDSCFRPVDGRPSVTGTEKGQKLKITQDPQFKRFGNTVDMNVALDTFGRHTWVPVPVCQVLRSWPFVILSFHSYNTLKFNS